MNAGFSLVRSFDPVVLFGSLSYSYRFKYESAGAEIKPGDSFDLEFGTGFAINQDISMSFKVTGSYIFTNQSDNVNVGATCTPFYFTFSLGKYLSDRSFIEPSVSFGVTRDASDFILGITYGYKF